MTDRKQLWRDKFIELARPEVGVGLTVAKVAKATNSKPKTVQAALRELARTDNTLANTIEQTRRKQSLPKAAATGTPIEVLRTAQYLVLETSEDGGILISKGNVEDSMSVRLTQAELGVVRGWLANLKE